MMNFHYIDGKKKSYPIYFTQIDRVYLHVAKIFKA